LASAKASLPAHASPFFTVQETVVNTIEWLIKTSPHCFSGCAFNIAEVE
jgi:hypothetical protein